MASLLYPAMQKSLTHTDFIDDYNELRDEYLSECRWFVEKRNETTKAKGFYCYSQNTDIISASKNKRGFCVKKWKVPRANFLIYRKA